MVDEETKLNATYIISVARKLGCSIFLLPEDIMEVRLQLCDEFAHFVRRPAIACFDVNIVANEIKLVHFVS